MTKVWLFKASNGGMEFTSDGVKALFIAHLKEHEGKRYRIEYVEDARSLSQNAYYWVYLDVIAGETGHTPEELHTLFKRKFLPRKFKLVLGEHIEIEQSTTRLKKHEFGEYLDRIAAETGVPLPDPEDAGYISN